MNAPAIPVDPGNQLLTATPCQMTVSPAETPAKADAQAWAAALADGAAKMNDAGLFVAGPGAQVERRRR